MPVDADVAHGRRAFRLTATAFLWSLGLVVAALLVPVYGGTQTRSATGIPTVTTNSNSTLVGENGLGILLVLAVPLLIMTTAVALDAPNSPPPAAHRNVTIV